MQSVQVAEAEVIARFRKRTPESAEMFRRACEVTPGGVMAGIKFFEPYPIFMSRAKGSYVWDVDGNRYVDYLLSYGALVLGHGDETVMKSMSSALDSFGTTVMGTPTALESEYGGMLRDLYHRDGMIRFTNSGLEATSLAARVARGFTGRRKVAKFEGHYHGAVDRLLYSYAPDVSHAGSPESPTPIGDSVDVDEGMLAESVVLPFNNWRGTERAIRENSEKLACVIMEPFEEGVIAARADFMADLRGLTRDLGIPLIFDEVKTGFRVRLGGATEFYSVTPDLTCLGKIIGGGVPIGAVVGDGEIMKQLDPRRASGGKVFHSGTFNGNPLSLSVGRATVEKISRRGRFESLVGRTDSLKAAMSKRLDSHAIPHAMAGEGAMFNFYLTDREVRNYRDAKSSNLGLRRLMDLDLISRGVYLKPENRFCLSLAHSEDDVKNTAGRFSDVLDALLPN